MLLLYRIFFNLDVPEHGENILVEEERKYVSGVSWCLKNIYWK